MITPLSLLVAKTTKLPAAAAIYRLAFGIEGEPTRMGHDWGVPPDPWKVEALAARVAGTLWCPSELLPRPVYTYRAAARSLMRKHEVEMPGDGPTGLLKYTRDVTAYYVAWTAALADAQDKLTAAVRDGAIPAFGVPINAITTVPGLDVHVPISASLLQQHPSRVIRLNGDLCCRGTSLTHLGSYDASLYFRDIQVDAAALRRLHPPGPLPDVSYLNPWDVIVWRAFGAAHTLNLGSRPESLTKPRSPPVELYDQHDLQMGAWAALGAAEWELKSLLRAGSVTAYGRQEAAEPDGRPAYRPEGIHTAIQPEVFLNERWAFNSGGQMYERLTGDRWTVRHGRSVPRERIFFEVAIRTAEISAAWGQSIMEPVARLDKPNTSPLQPAQSASESLLLAQLKTSKKRKPHGRNYIALDKPLVEEMHTMIMTKTATSPWDAAMAVASRATGSNTTLESRAKRLLGRYSEAFSSERN